MSLLRRIADASMHTNPNLRIPQPDASPGSSHHPALQLTRPFRPSSLSPLSPTDVDGGSDSGMDFADMAARRYSHCQTSSSPRAQSHSGDYQRYDSSMTEELTSYHFGGNAGGGMTPMRGGSPGLRGHSPVRHGSDPSGPRGISPQPSMELKVCVGGFGVGLPICMFLFCLWLAM